MFQIALEYSRGFLDIWKVSQISFRIHLYVLLKNNYKLGTIWNIKINQIKKTRLFSKCSRKLQRFLECSRMFKFFKMEILQNVPGFFNFSKLDCTKMFYKCSEIWKIFQWFLECSKIFPNVPALSWKFSHYFPEYTNFPKNHFLNYCVFFLKCFRMFQIFTIFPIENFLKCFW